MPRAFTEERKAELRRKLLDLGKAAFTRYGLEKTTVGELARAAGIAKGTFYHFFPSKEALFAEVLLEEYPRMANVLIAESFDAVDDTREALVRFMKQMVKLIETDELAKAFLSAPDSGERILAALNLQGLDDSQRRELFFPIPEAIARAQNRGDIVEGDPMEIAQVLGSIKIFPLYKEQLPPEWYPRIVERTAQVIADGLTCPARRRGSG